MKSQLSKMAALWVVVLAGIANGAEPAKKYATPAEAMAAAEAAHDRGDHAASIDCLSASAQDELVQMLVGIASLTANAPDGTGGNKELEAIFAKHGMKDRTRKVGEADEAYVKRIAAQATDRRGFLVDAMNFSREGGKASPCIKGQLKELKITGDTATAKYIVKDSPNSSVDQDVKFRKVDGSWLLDGLHAFVNANPRRRPASAPASAPANR